MAIYHFSTKVISRAAGSSALAAATYRSASRLHDERLDRHHDFSNKAGVVHSEVMLPDGAPEEWRDRERLWNDVEAAERSEEHTSELQSLMRISYAVFCLKKKIYTKSICTLLTTKHQLCTHKYLSVVLNNLI